MTTQPPGTYTSTARHLHWIMAIIWITAWLLGMAAAYLKGVITTDPSLTFLHKALASTLLHKALASTLLLLIVLRILWRIMNPPPALPDSMSAFMQRTAHIGHLLLYAVALLALPVSGWFWSSVAGKPIMMLGLVELPSLMGADPDLYDLAKWTHTLIAWACGVLVGGHILIAFKHHFVDKDGVLQGMLSAKRR